jgi:hypothetical protein
MKPANVFQLVLAEKFASARGAAMRLGLAFLLGLPFVLAAMPARVKAAGLVMLIVFTSFFGAAVGLVRWRTEGRITRLRVLPTPVWKTSGDYLLANSAVDLMQTGPVLVLLVVLNGNTTDIGLYAAGAGLFSATVLILNLLGILLGWAMKSNPEVHLFGAVAVGLIAFFSGLFPVPHAISRLVTAVAAWNPVGVLARALEKIMTGGYGMSSMATVGGACFVVVLLLVIILRVYNWNGLFASRQA